MFTSECLAADDAGELPVRSLGGFGDDWPLAYAELLPYYERTDRDFGISGIGGDPAYPPGAEPRRSPPCRSAPAVCALPGPRPAWGGTGGPTTTRSCPRPTTAATRASSADLEQGCGEGAKARPT